MNDDLEDVNFFPRGHDLPTGFCNTQELVRRAGITAKQGYYWTERGYLIPEDCGAGSGYQRAFSDAEVEVARKVGGLLREGYRLDAAVRRARGPDGHTNGHTCDRGAPHKSEG